MRILVILVSRVSLQDGVSDTTTTSGHSKSKTSYRSPLSEFRSLEAAKFAARSSFVTAIISSLFLSGCVEKETIESYARNPVGCEVRPAQWYAEKVTTKAGQDELRKQIRSYGMRAEHHGKQVDFVSLTEAEKSEQSNKSLQCLREVIWASETLQKAGLSVQ